MRTPSRLRHQNTRLVAVYTSQLIDTTPCRFDVSALRALNGCARLWPGSFTAAAYAFPLEHIGNIRIDVPIDDV